MAVITQSGHLGEIISEELTASGVGVRALVGTGNQLDVSAEDMLGYFGDDPHTKVIALYLEGVRDGVRFMRLAAEAAKQKPVVVFKAGKTGAGARAALTHTASMAGDHQVYQAAFRRCGLVEVPDFQGLIDASVSLSMFPPMPGRRLVILTNAGGVGAIAADEAQSSGLDVKPLSGGARGRLAKEFRSSRFISIASLTNPVDLTASVSTDEFVKAAELILGLPECDALLVMPTHQTPAIDFDIAERLSQVISASGKPACACVMGRSDLATMIENDFLDRGIPAFRTPERAVRALSWAASYRKLRAGAAPPVPTRKSDAFPGLGGRAGPLDQKAVSRLLRAYGIGQPRQATVLSARDLPRAVALGFPVACKLVSRGLVHKKDAGGVALGIANRKDLASVFSKFRDRARGLGLPFEGMLVQEMVEGGVELIIGGTRDQTFGPVVAFGSGGTLAELTHDFGLEIAPLDPGRAKELIGATKAGKVVQGFRGGPAVDMESLCGVVSRFSRILTENPSLAEAEINPLIGRGASLYAVDARAVLGYRQTLKSGPPGRRAS